MVLSMKTTSEDWVMVGVFCNASTLPKKKLNHYSLFYDVATFDVDRNV